MNETRYASVICEYNPFHFGHLYQMKALRSEFDGVVCILSGNIVQRGSAAVADKYLRAEAALKSGANLVLELPVPWCCASARDFARAGVHIADCIGASHLAFGAEDPLEKLEAIFSLVSSDDFKTRLENAVETNKNLSYPQALKTLVGIALGEEYASFSEKPNNILALEYLSAMKNKNIDPFVVKRDLSLASSSSIRAKTDADLMLAELPDESKKVFESAKGGDFPRDIKKLDSFFIGALRRIGSLDIMPDSIYSTPDDLIKKLLSEAVRVNSVDELIAECSDKIYTQARVRRAINALVFGITAERVGEMPSYTCVLAADKIGREILRSAKKKEKIDIITKPVRALEASRETRESFLFAKGIEDVIALSAPKPIPADSGKSPFILKEEI